MNITCISKSRLYNRKDLDRFNEMQQYFGWDDATAEAKIGTWMSLNNRSDESEFPTIKQMKKYVKSSKKDANTYRENDTVPRVHSVDHRLQSLFNTTQAKSINTNLDELNKKKWNGVWEILESSKEFSTIVNLLRNLNSSDSIFERLKSVKIEIEDVSINNPIQKKAYKGRRAYYDATNRTIHINKNASFVNNDSSSVLLHEIMHAITLDLIESNPEQSKALYDILKEYRKNNGSRYFNYTDSQEQEDKLLREFIADIFSNKTLIEEMKNMKSTKKFTLWDKFKLFFNNLFSGSLFSNIKEDSLMAQASSELVKLLEMSATQQAKGYYMENENATEQSIDTHQEDSPVNLSLDYQMRRSWTPQVIQNRAIRITKIFTDIVTDLEKNLPEIEQLSSSAATRKYIIAAKYGAGNILNKVRERISETYANKDWVTETVHELYDESDWNNPKVESKINHIYEQGKLMLEYFEPICIVASSEIKRQEGVSILTKDGEVVDLSEEQLLSDEEIQTKHEEGWFYDAHEQSMEDMMEFETKSILANLYEVDSEGYNVKFDDLEEPLPIDFRMALATTANIVGRCTVDTQMLPMLLKTSEKYPWMRQIVENLTGRDTDISSLYEGLSDEDVRRKAYNLCSIFWKDMHKIFVNIGTQNLEEDKKNPDGSKIVCTTTNRTEGSDALMKSFEDVCYGNRTLFNENGKPYKRVYNYDGTFNTTVYDELHSELQKSELYYRIPDFKVDAQDIDLIDRLLKGFGVNIPKETIARVFDTTKEVTDKQKEQAKNIKDVLFGFYATNKSKNQPLQGILKDNGTTNIFDVFQKNYKTIADTFDEDSYGFEESQARVSVDGESKSLFSRIYPNPINTIVNRLKNIDGISEKSYLARLQRDYGHNWWFAPTVDNNGNGVFRPGLLKDLAEDSDTRTGLKVTTLKSSNGISYAHEIDAQAEETRLNQFENTNHTINGKSFRDYSVPTFSDTGESYFMSLRYFNIKNTKEREELVDRLCHAVRQEIDRFNVVKARKKNPNAVPIAGFDDFGEDFHFFPSLNKNKIEFFAEFNKRSNNPTEQQEFLRERVMDALEEEFEYYLSEFNRWEVSQLPNSMHKESSKYRQPIVSYIDSIKKARSNQPIDRQSETILENIVHQLATYTLTQRQFDGLIENAANILSLGIQDENWKNMVRNQLKSFQLDKTNLAKLEDYFINNFYAQTQIIGITMRDPAFLGSNDKFQKRYKMFYSPVSTCYTCEYVWDENGNLQLVDSEESDLTKKTEYSLILADDELEKAISYDNIKTALDDKVASGILTRPQANLILNNFTKINRSDAQCYRTLQSWQKCLNMIGKGYNKKMQQSINRLMNPDKYGQWTYEDYHNVWEIFKPFVASYTSKPSMLDTENDFNSQFENIQTPVMHKNSEFLLLAMYGALSGVMKDNWKLKAINEFMVKHGIDKIQFESAVKVGIQSPIDLSKCTTPEEITSTLEVVTGLSNNKQAKDGDPQVITSIPFSDWGISTSMPEHLLEHEESSMGTQIMKIIMEGLSEDPNKEVKVGNTVRTYKQWLKLYQEIHVQNIKDSFAEVGIKFSSNEELARYLKGQILSQNKYNSELIAHLEVDKNGNFINPIIDPILRNQFDSLIASLVRNNVTKRMARLGALPQVASYGFDDLQLRFQDRNGNLILTEKEFNEKGSNVEGITTWEEYKEKVASNSARIAYMEVLLPPFDNNFMANINDAFIFKSNVYDKNGKLIHRSGEFNHELFNKKLDEKLRQGIANRVPTETKHSMIPIYIKGFLPSQNSSCVVCPAEWIAISDSDNDGDKLYTYFYHSRVIWDNEKIKKAYAKEHNLSSRDVDILWDEIIAGHSGKDIKDFKDFVDKAKQDPDYIKTIKPIEFNLDDIERKSGETDQEYEFRRELESIKSNSHEARNNKMIELMSAILQTDDNTAEIMLPGGFPVVKSVSDKMKKLLHVNNNACSICNAAVRTQQQVNNSAGRNLIGIYANHRSFRPLLEMANITLKEPYRFTINGNQSLPRLDNGTLTWSLSAKKNARKEFISDNISNFSGASVDNAKDPRLGHLGQNEITAPLTMLLIHLGYTIEEASIFISQPAIKRCVRTYLINGRKGFLNNIVDDEIKALGHESDGHTLSGAQVEELPLSLLEEQIDRDSSGVIQTPDDAFIQAKVLSEFKKILTASQSLQQVLDITKADTQVGSLTSRSSENKLKLQKIEKVIDKIHDAGFPFSGMSKLVPELNSEEDVDNSEIPYISAFRYYGIQSIEDIMKPMSMTFNDLVDQVHSDALDKTNLTNLDADTIDGLTNATVSYLFSTLPLFKEHTRDKFIKGAVKILSEIKRKNLLPDNQLIKDLTVSITGNKYSRNYPFIRLNRNTRKNLRSIEVYQTAWKDLIVNGNKTINMSFGEMTYKELSDILLNYCFIAKGLGVGRGTFLHCFPTSELNTIEGYIDRVAKLNMLKRTSSPSERIIDQYVANNPDNYRLVHRIDLKKLNMRDIIKDNKVIPNVIEADFTKDNAELFRVEGSGSNERRTPHPYIYFTDEIGRRYLYKSVESEYSNHGMTFVRMQVLGNVEAGFFEEYEMGKDVIFGMPGCMESALPANSNMIADSKLRNEVDKIKQESIQKGEELTRSDYIEIINSLLGDQKPVNKTIDNYEPQQEDATGMKFCITI